MPIICRLPGGSKGNGSGSSDLQLNIFTQPDEPETKDGIWVQRSNTHKKIVVDNLISASGEWSDMSTAPISFDNTKPVLLNGNIIAFDHACNLWTFDGTAWTQIGNNSAGISGQLCTLNNVLYCASGWGPLDSTGENWGPALFRWTGSDWTKIVNISVSDSDTIYVNSCVVHNGYIYMFKMVTNSNGIQSTQLLRSNGSSFTSVASSSYIVGVKGNGVVFNSKIYWLGDYANSDYTIEINPCMITSTGSNISVPSANDTPFSSSNSMMWSANVFDNIIHTFVSVSSNVYKHYTFDGNTWTKLFDMTHTIQMYLCAYNTRLYAFGSNQIMYYSKTHDKYPAHTLILQIADTHDGPYLTSLVDVSSIVTNGRFLTNFNDVFFVGESGLETTDPIYYGDGSKWVKFKN